LTIYSKAWTGCYETWVLKEHFGYTNGNGKFHWHYWKDDWSFSLKAIFTSNIMNQNPLLTFYNCMTFFFF